MALASVTPINCHKGLVFVTPKDSLDLREVMFRDSVIGIVKEVHTGKYEIKAKQGKPRTGELSLTNACCSILSSHLLVSAEDRREVTF